MISPSELPVRAHLHRREAATGVVREGRPALAVEGIARRASEAVVEARDLEVILPLVGAVAVEVVGVKVRDDTGGRGVDEVADAVIGHGDGRGDTVVVIFGACQIARVIVGVVGDDASRPRAAGELAVGGIGVGRALAVGVEFVGHAARWFVVEPAGRVAVSERLVAVGGH